MDRRIMMLALAGGGAGLAVGPSLAQSHSTMGSAETEHAKRTASAGAATLQTSDMALGKAGNPKVKEFAQFEHDEQTTVAEIIKSMFPSLPSPPPETNATGMISRMRAMPAGAEFDQAYVAGQIDGHEMLLKIQDDYLKVGKDLPTIAVTKLVRGMVKEHLALLAELSKMVG